MLTDNPHDRHLIEQVFPSDWTNPTPEGRYNLVVIGAGPAGLVAAFGAAGLGGRVAIIEKYLLGGDCLNLGCVPSKAIIRAAHAAHGAHGDARFGVSTVGVNVDFAVAMDNMRRVRAGIGHHDSATRLKATGVDVFLGAGEFIGPDRVKVGDAELHFARALVATGARPMVPPIPGLAEVGARTNETIFDLIELPPRLTIIGAGSIGCELAQTFARLGSEVTLVDMATRVLPRDDPDAAPIVARSLEADGVRLMLGAKVRRFETTGAGRTVHVEAGGETHRLDSDEILLSMGRRPNIENLGLEQGGINAERTGIVVDAFLRTSNPKVYACGDVVAHHQFTHTADAQARIVLQNALFFGRKRVGDLVVPWATYTSPEVAHVGITHQQAAADPNITSITVGIGETDRGRCDGEDEGFARCYVNKAGHVVGATVVAHQAGDLIGEMVLAATHRMTLAQVASAIHPYPTRVEVWKKIADQHNKTRLTPFVARVLAWVLSWRR